MLKIRKIIAIVCVFTFTQTNVQSRQEENVNREKILMILRGSINPPTLEHFRIFEVARDYFRDGKNVDVIGGIISPVHEKYKKGSVKLVQNQHRRNMINLSLASSDWIRLSDWEFQQKDFTPLYEVFQYYQNNVDSILNGTNESIPNWLPSNITELRGQKIHVKLICGTDTLHSFADKNSCTNCSPWSDTELEKILKHFGIVVVTRGNIDPRRIIFNSNLLYDFRSNITIIEDWIPTSISSTVIRTHLQRGLSVKYLLNDDVIRYIYENQLYGSG